MKHPRTVIAIVVFTCALVFGGGGVLVGYLWGHIDSDGLNAPANSAVVATALRAYRKGEVENAISLLESGLDSTLIERWSFDLRPHPLAGLVGDAKVKAKVMAFAADYRTEVPSTSPEEGVRAAIAEVAARYRSAQ